MTKREELFCLLKLYEQGKYDIDNFCDELTRILYYENGAIKELDNYEKEIFGVLGNVANRFSPYIEDHKRFPNGFYTEEDVKNAINMVYKKLDINL